MSNDPRRVLGEAVQRAAAMIMLRRKGVAQQPIDALPRGRHLRAIILVCRLAAGVEFLLGGDMYAQAVGFEAEAAQPTDEFLLRHNARAAAGQFAIDTLVD